MKVAICGCAINCAEYIDAIFKNISLMSQKLKISHIIISYDESKDDTLKKLKRFEKYSDIVHLIKTDEPLTNNRIQNMCNSRNRIMKFLLELEKKPDYYIMMNFDDTCCKPLDLDTLVSAFKIKDQWDSISFNNKQYHDYWALSFDEYIFSCWHMPNPKDIMKDMNLQLKKNFKKQKYIEVDSAYNGFAIYRTETFINQRYKSMIDFSIFDKNKLIKLMTKYKFKIIKQYFHDCEHRSFHFNAKKNKNARILLLKKNLFPKYFKKDELNLY
jgi:hypothetical protein